MISRYELSKKEFTPGEYQAYKEELAERHKMFQDTKLFKKLRDATDHCECCGRPKWDAYRMDVHHIIPRRYDECTNNEDNLIVLCNKCHSKLETAISYHSDVDKIKNITKKFLEKHKYDYAQQDLWGEVNYDERN